MSMNIKVSQPFRDKYRESCFYDAYKVKAEIETTNFIDDQGNWNKCILKFKTGNNVYGLIEYFKKGLDNSTDYVELEINGIIENQYDKFIDAELGMVDIIRSE